ncbi:MAG: NAD(P)-binding domain-containing protein [Proteobacteria bacterium]|nr:NAD(P)-binding domain-containing protein [Pseudomonadota bacterium]
MTRDILKLSFEFSPKMGVRELPQVDADYQSNVGGLYIVGDLADAPIIKVALNQGYEVACAIWKDLGASTSDEDLLDVVIIGAGPAGIGASLALHETDARYVVLEKSEPFATIQNFPRNKLIFSEPRHIESKGDFWFEDARTDELIERWGQALDDRSLHIQQPVEVTDVQKAAHGFDVTTSTGVVRTRRVMLATGRRGTVNRISVDGEQLEKVRYTLKDPDDHAGRRVLVVGGGDSAVEAACDCADAGAQVTIAYRKAEFTRPKAKNKERLDRYIADGRVAAEMSASPLEITAETVRLKVSGEEKTLENDDVLVFAGTRLPYAFLEKLGIRMQGHMDALRMLWISSFALLTYLFYILKHKKDFFPFGEGDVLGFVPGLFQLDLGFRTVEFSFFGTCLYSLLILVFGIRAYRRYPAKVQKQRYLSLIGFQWVFLFGIPELLAPLVIERPWKVYAMTVPWPLSIWSLVDAPAWANGDTGAAVGWLAAGAIVTFVAIPVFVRYQGERFCSYLCGCGGLAETLGDFWRHLAPRGQTAVKLEQMGRWILLAAVPVTLLILNDAWQFWNAGALYNTKAFAEHWYGLMVDFWLASVVGVALYPYLGNRMWCRFFCPLRAYMEELARRISKITIKSNDKCIGCGECTRFCQMGIDVQSYAQRQDDMDNSDSACIQCGICIQVCPMDVLSIGERNEVTLAF